MRKYQIILLLLFLSAIFKPVFADTNELNNSWNYYKQVFISSEGKVVDYQKDAITTSEGQSYALLRAVLMNDKYTFNKVYQWTKSNLTRSEDSLFSWIWGKKNESWQIIDKNTASDADVDTALALILASKKWNNKHYLKEAKRILTGIWEQETIEINGLRILTSGKVQNNTEDISINPSYFAPYAFRVFSKVDTTHDWSKLTDSSYILMNQVIDKTESGLPTDWFQINKSTGEILIDKGSPKSNFSYDAIRTFIRFYLDYKVNNDKRAEKLLSRTQLFIDKWVKEKKFYTNYKQNGEIENTDEAIGSIAVLLPAIKLKNNDIAEEIYKSRIQTHYKEAGYWNDPIDYYAQNLVWFGVYIYLNDTENLILLNKVPK